MNLVEQETLQSKIISLIDFTQLADTVVEADIIRLCQDALTPLGPVAAVCIPRQFVAIAKKQLLNSSILVATVANFPEGTKTLAEVEAEVRDIIQTGADEVDIVIPYHFYHEDKADKARLFMQHMSNICKNQITLKFILETGALNDVSKIEQASIDAIQAGADFIKTSTGKVAVGATLEAAEVMLQAIKQYASHKTVGFKASGGIRNFEQALLYVNLAEKIMGPEWVNANRFRLGASVLVNAILQQPDCTSQRNY